MLTDLERNQILRAIRHSGTYEPEEALSYVEEEMTFASYDKAKDFLKWVHTNGLSFGWGNIDQVYATYQARFQGEPK